MRVICTNEGLVSNFELLELLRQRTREPGHAPRYPQPHDPFPTELQVLPCEVVDLYIWMFPRAVLWSFEQDLVRLSNPVTTFWLVGLTWRNSFLTSTFNHLNLFNAMQSMSLTSAECLNLINLKPSCNVEIYLVGSAISTVGYEASLKSFS